MNLQDSLHPKANFQKCLAYHFFLWVFITLCIICWWVPVCALSWWTCLCILWIFCAKAILTLPLTTICVKISPRNYKLSLEILVFWWKGKKSSPSTILISWIWDLSQHNTLKPKKKVLSALTDYFYSFTFATSTHIHIFKECLAAPCFHMYKQIIYLFIWHMQIYLRHI